MLTNLIVGLINMICNFMFKIVPDMSNVTSTFSNAQSFAGTVVDFIKQVNFVVPLPTIVAIVTIEVGIQVALVLFWVGDKVVKTVCSLIP